MTEGYRLSPDICVNNQDTNITCQVITVMFIHKGARKLSGLSQISDLKWKKTRTARADYLTKLSIGRERIWVKDMTQNADVPLTELQRSMVQMGESSRRAKVTAELHWADRLPLHRPLKAHGIGRNTEGL